jgi:hypothetical protein
VAEIVAKDNRIMRMRTVESLKRLASAVQLRPWATILFNKLVIAVSLKWISWVRADESFASCNTPMPPRQAQITAGN